MKIDEVTVLNVDGRLLASGSDSIEQAPDNLLALEKEVSGEIRENVSKTLAPYLTLRNFEVSVAARLNADKTQTNETIYNPDGRAERSVRVVKEKQASQNSAGESPAGVEANLPKSKTSSSDSKQSKDSTDKKEELTNYEISSKQTTTTSEGFVITGLSIAVLVNRAGLAASLGDKASPEAIDKQAKEIEQLVISAAGLKKERGDVAKISVVDFLDSGKDMEPVAGPSFVEILERQSGALVSAGAVLVVTALLIMFGIRPVTRALLAAPAEPDALESPMAMGSGLGGMEMGSGMDMAMAPALTSDMSDGEGDGNLLIKSEDGRDQFLQELLQRRDKSPARHLQKLVDFDEEHAAAILKQWIRQGESA